ncbi:MAG: substrate-binding domain-containing protein [Planctomycetes bacterium]|nr:substrate-binding domain-containing protein [Planctomycetota bacterium]
MISGRTMVNDRIKKYLFRIIEKANAGDKLPSVREMQKRFNCSHATIDKALNELDRDGHIERLAGRGIFVATREKRILAEKKAEIQNGNVIYAYPDYISYEFSIITQQAEAASVRAGFNLVNMKMKIDTTYEYLLERTRSTRDLAGVIILSNGSPFESKVLDELARLGKPVVIINPKEENEASETLHYVYPDHFRSGYLLAEHMLDLGHKAIAYIHNEPTTLMSRLRYKGIKAALQDKGRKLGSLLRSKETTRQWEDSTKVAYEWTKNHLSDENRPSAIIYDSMNGCVAGIRAINDLGLKIPEDVAIACEGQGFYDEYLCPRITAALYDYRALATRAVNIIRDNPARARSEVIPVNLQVNEST